MFILNKNGNRLVKTDDFVEISFIDETNEMRELHPASNLTAFTIRAYREPKNKATSVLIATYDDKEEAQEAYLQMCRAISVGASLFSFCSLTQENVMDTETYLEICENGGISQPTR